MTDMLRVLAPREEGGQSYFSDGGKRGLSISVVFTSLATIFVAARVYTRTRLMKRMEPNDWMILIALVSPSSRTLPRHDN